MEMINGYSSEDAKKLIASTLCLYVGHGKGLSWDDLAEATGIKSRTLRSYSEAGGSLMPLDTFMTVFTRLPPAAFARVARHMGFSASPAEIDDDATVRRVLSQSARLVADGNEFLEDGKLSPSERAILAQRAGELLPAMQSIAAYGSSSH